MRIALVQQHAGPDKAENVARGLGALETAAHAGTPGDTGAPVYRTRAGDIGIAVCYDRHYPEYMRARALAGADLVVVPQAGSVGEWPEGLYEAQMRVAAFQNGYYVALCNRVGPEEKLTFAGESFVCSLTAQSLRGRSRARTRSFTPISISRRTRRPTPASYFCGTGGRSYTPHR